jgi:predicted PurR-regulated permease PerM
MEASGWQPPLWYARLAAIAWRAVVIVMALSLLVAGIVGLSAIILPLVLGLLFACGLHPLFTRLRRAGLPAGLASLMSVLLIVVVIALVGWLAISAVADQWDDIEGLIEAGRELLVDTAEDAGIDPETAEAVDADLSNLAGSIADVLVGGFVQLLPTVAGFIASVMLSFLVAFFFLKDGQTMWRWIVTRLGEFGVLTDRTGRHVWKTLSGFIIGQTLIALLDATGIALGALILGVPEVAAIFMITFIGAYIPFVGAFLSGLVAVMLALGDDGLGAGIAMLVVVLIVQVLEGNVFQPWIQGRAVKLHPLIVALSVAAGGALAGLLGVFLAVPITAAGVVTLSELRAAGILGPGESPLASDH